MVRAKILGSLELIDEGETDHKVVMIRETDPHFSSVNSIQDYEAHHPGLTKKLVDWLKNYKTSDGKPVNKLASESPTTQSQATEVVEEVSKMYQNLISGSTDHGYKLPKK